MKRIKSPSPNFSSRNGFKPELVVVHCTEGHFPTDLEYLRNPNPGGSVGPVSAHFLIAPNGDIHELVDVANTAWHAGRVMNPTVPLKPGINPNLYSIGIETSVKPGGNATPEQLISLKELVRGLGTKYTIPLDRNHVIGHRDIFSAKVCPGTINIYDILDKTPELKVEPKKPSKKEKRRIWALILRMLKSK